jgi:SSS family solute:Na+ symporter
MTPYQTITALLLVAYVIAVAYIGVRNRHGEGSESFFLASRQLPPWLLAVTFIASWWGGGSAIDLADHAYAGGLNSFWIYGVPVLLSTFLMFLFAGAIRKITTLSQPQIMALRYNSKAALMLTIFILIFMLIGTAVQVIVLGNFFHSFFGLSYELAATLGVGAVLFYSCFGGFKGVVLTDLFQLCFFLVTSVVLLGLAYVKSGGWEAVVLTAESRGQIGYTDFFHDVSSNLAYVITFGASWMIQANIWQRISAARTPQDARKMMAISFFVFIPLYLMVTLTGMFASTFYDAVPSGGIVPDMVKNMSSPVLSAILFLGLCSAIMSTMDSMINTASLSITVDLWQKYRRAEATLKQQVLVGRISTVLVSVIALFIGLKVRSVLTVSWIGADFIATGVFVPLVLGFLWKRGTSTAAVASMVFGLLFSTYNLLYALGLKLPVAWETASARQALVGMCASFIVFVGVSLFTKDPDEHGADFVKSAGMIK